jgi:peroxiredoxin family protein
VPPKKKGHGCLIAFLIVLVIFLVGVGSCTAFVVVNVAPLVSMEMKIQQEVGVKSSTFNSTNGRTTWVVTVEPGFDNSADAAVIACKVKSDLAGTQFSNDTVQVVDAYGSVLATGAVCP